MASGQIEEKIELHFNDCLDVVGLHGQLGRIFRELLERVGIPMQSVLVAPFL